MNKGILYGVGVGCGDPDDITVKALKIIKMCDVLAFPVTAKGGTAALNIVKCAADIKDKLKMPFNSMMTKDADLINLMYSEYGKKLSLLLDDGKNVAFITIGDVSVYSTFWYLGNVMSGMGYEIKTVSGVPSFCSAASALNIPIALGEEPIHIIPSSYDISRICELYGNIILMKSGNEIENVVCFLRKNGLDKRTALVQNCGMDNEKIYTQLPENIDNSYFSVFIIRSK